MTPREKKLAAAVIVLILLGGGSWAWKKYDEWASQARASRDSAAASLQTALLDQQKTRAAVRQLRGWRDKSLPSNTNIAQSEYRAWLLEKLQEAKLDIADVTPTGGGQRSDAFQSLNFTVNADGNLPAVVSFLDSFYRSDQLHKIGVLRLTPLPDSKQLRVVLNIEALVLEGTQRESGLADGKSDRLALESAEKYIDRINGRNLFVAYTPPTPPPAKVVVKEKPKPPEKPKFDDSKHAKVTAILGGDELQAWVHLKTKGETLRVKQGDELKVGLFEGKVVEVRPQHLVVETPEGVLAVRVGDSLRDGKPQAGS